MEKIRIAIDALESTLNNKVGMGHYCCNLIKALSLADFNNQYSLYVKKSRDFDLTAANPNFKYVQLGSPLIRSFWSQIRLPLELVFSRPDILHVPTGHKLPFNCPKKSIVTIHDLAFLKFPQYFRSGTRQRSAFFTKDAVLRAKKIIAISQSTKKDILDFYGVDDKKVEVVYHGVDRSFFQKPEKDEEQAVLNKFSINMPFILYVGVLQPRKNISRMILAFKQILSRFKGNLQLVIAGNKGWMYEEIFNTVKQAGIEDRVVFTGYVSVEEVISLLHKARIFVLVSLYEGFGLPLVEAMAAQVPIISSNVSSIPEVVGQAGLLVDPYDQDQIAGAMLDILENPSLAVDLIEKANKRVKDFSWQQAASKTLEIYESVFKDKQVK
jgi:glycosyltransferase involved in cell wall biosynthesis